MPQITITEALSELNLIKKKIEKKQTDVLPNLVRWDHMPDTFAKAGGSETHISSEIQSINDLRKRFVKIRSAIAEVNTKTSITVGSTTMTVNEWLNWKREIADDSRKFANNVANSVKHALDQQAQKPQLIKDDAGNVKIVNLIPNVDYAHCLKVVDEIDEMTEKLDGQLSLKNATIMIKV